MTDPAARRDLIGRLRAAGCVFAEDEADLLLGTGATGPALDGMVERRAAGVPLEHMLGWAEFSGLRIAVDDGVFVPRRRSQFLAGRAADLAALVTPATQTAAGPPEPRVCVVDLCCGAGALGAVVATQVPGTRLFAADIDPAAVRCARRNLEPLGGRVHAGDLFDPLPADLRGHVDVLIANAPYVPTGEIGLMPAEARLHEPPVALDGGGDGLAVLRRVLERAPDWLAPRGSLLMECAAHQAAPLANSVTAAGLFSRVEHDTDLGATVVIATRH